VDSDRLRMLVFASPMTIARVPVTVALIYKGHVSNVFHLGFQMMF